MELVLYKGSCDFYSIHTNFYMLFRADFLLKYIKELKKI